jgi:Stage II sporulation protein E (SpoIIE)
MVWSLTCMAIALAALAAGAQQRVVLGNSAVELTGPWRFHTGDDFRWAQPGFDDSHWGTMDLTLPNGSVSPFDGSPGFLPGWTTRGYPTYAGYAWYRLQILVQDLASPPAARLGVIMPGDFDDAYEIYVNGRYLGGFGDFSAHGVTSYNSVPRAFPLPAGLELRQPITLAIRIYMSPERRFTDQDAGGLHGPPVLGQNATIQALDNVAWFTETKILTAGFVEDAVVLLALIIAFGLYALDRQEYAYLWLGSTLAAIFVGRTVADTAHVTTWLSLNHQFFVSGLTRTFIFIGWPLFWSHWFRLSENKWLHRVLWPMGLVLWIDTCLMQSPIYGVITPVGASVLLIPLGVVIKTALNAVLLWVTYKGIRKNRIEGLLALPAVLLREFAAYADRLVLVHVPVVLYLRGYGVHVEQISILLMIVIILALLLRRFLQAQRKREQLKKELEATRAVQQVLVSKEIPEVPGFRIASVYRPAGLVGGDFFQVLPDATGGVLVVIGDVSGKGMPAAMTVSLLVGTIRTLARFTSEPGEILAEMNHRLVGHSSGGFTTCLVLKADADGKVTLANAGHLPPYRNGAELEMEGGLPLGLMTQSTYEETSFMLGMAEQLTLLTDGVIEARGETGELFGFERTVAISKQSAQSIAETAQTFGQDDDITVVTVVRVG